MNTTTEQTSANIANIYCQTAKEEGMITENCPILAIHNTHSKSEAVVKALQNSGFDMKKLSIVGRDYDMAEHVVGYYNAWDRMKYWGKTGVCWGLLIGFILYFAPLIGQLLVAGSPMDRLVTTLEGAVMVGGLGMLAAGLFSLFIPKDSVLRYDTKLQKGQFIVIAHAPKSELELAQRILRRTNLSLLEEAPSAFPAAAPHPMGA